MEVALEGPVRDRAGLPRATLGTSLSAMENPYASSLSDSSSDSQLQGLTPGVMQALGGTKPWVRFCSVIGFIATGMMVLGALAMLLAGGAMFAAGGTEAPAALGAAMPVVMCLVYLAIAALYLFPSVKLWKYGTHILKLMNSQSMNDLELALEAQRSFWKFVGIMILVVLVIYVILIIAMVAFGIFAGAALAPMAAP